MTLDRDVVVLGTGPAGLQAAIHAVRKKVSVLVLGRAPQSSLHQAHLENFCCLGRTDGREFLAAGQEQAKGFGAEFLEEDVVAIAPAGQGFALRTETGETVSCRALVLAMGISRHKLGVPGEKELLGRGVSYCVDCDGGFFRGEKVAVVGGGSAAVSGALTLLFFAGEVHLIHQGLTVAPALAARLGESAVILHPGRRVSRILGADKVEGLELDDGSRLAVAGVFIELGAKGAIELASGLGVELDPANLQFVKTDQEQRTNLAGVYAAGDLTGPPWQVAKAVGQGCVAGLAAAEYVKKLA